MCGIVGYSGNEDAALLVMQSLKRLEYRGYDSWGIVSLSNNKLSSEKKVGRISEAKLSLPKSKIAIGHTRWATHGQVTKQNAHPHLGCKQKVAIVHNGIVENYLTLREGLLKKGHKFSGETDSEVIAHLIEDEKKKAIPFEKAVANAASKLDGSFAVVALDSETGSMVGIRKNSPLVLGIGKGNSFFLASDVNAFLKHTKKVIFLEDNDLVLLKGHHASFFDFKSMKKLKKKEVEVKWSSEEAEKMGFKHFMLKEIFEQPEKAIATMEGRLVAGKVVLPEFEKILKKANSFNRIIFLGCGTAFYAGLVQKYLFEELCRIPVEAEYASEFRYRNPVVGKKDLVIAISQSGETADTLAAIREAKAKGATLVSIVNVVDSTIARESDSVLYTRAGPEIGVASTKAFTCQLVAIAMLAIAFAVKRKAVSKSKAASLVASLKKLPVLMQETLEEKAVIKAIASKYSKKTNALFLGRGHNYPIALEGALKLKEISYIHAEAMPAAEMKHGPIALIDKEMPVVFIAIRDQTYEKVLSNVEEVKARAGKVIVVTDKGNTVLEEMVDDTIFVPKSEELLQPIINVIPMQLLAYYVADKRGCDVDKPRNLAKSVTVE